jgi:hypothetical protein
LITVVLTHTRLRVPTPCPHIAGFEQRETPHGNGSTATLAIGPTPIGTLTQEDTAEPAFFTPNGTDPYTAAWYRRFAAQCTRHGHPIRELDLALLLMEEYHTEQHAAAARKRHGWLLRRITDTQAVEFAHIPDLRNLDSSQRRAALQPFTGESATSHRWQLWIPSRRRWSRFTMPSTALDDAHKSARRRDESASGAAC